MNIKKSKKLQIISAYSKGIIIDKVIIDELKSNEFIMEFDGKKIILTPVNSKQIEKGV